MLKMISTSGLVALVRKVAQRLEYLLSKQKALAKAQFRLGVLHETQNDYQAAVVAYRTALHHDDQKADWHFRLGRSLAEAGQQREAVLSLKAALARNPAHKGAIVRLARLLYQDDRAEEAQDLLRRAPAAASIKTLEGTLHQYLGNFDAAEDCFSLVAEGQQNKGTALANLAHIYWLRGQRAQAMELLHSTIRDHPRFLRPVTLFGRYAEHPEEVEHLFEELQIRTNSNIPGRNYAQLVRTCMRPEATETARQVAEAAAIRLASLARSGKALIKRNEHTGLPTGAFTEARGNIALSDLAEVGRQNGIRFFLMGGTLLGHVRDGALITWDKDLDLGCFADEATASDIRRIFQEHPRFLLESCFEEEHGLVKAKHFCGTPIDIFINVRHPDRTSHSGQIITWYNEPFDLKPAEVMGAPLYLPDDPEKYLLEHYGPNWRTPDPHFDVFHESPYIQATNSKRIYIYAMAKAIDLISTGATDILDLRIRRALNSQSSELADGFLTVLNHFARHTPRVQLRP